MPVCPTCHAEPPYQVVLRDTYVRSNIECVSPFLLGQPNQARRIRSIDGILQKYIDLGVTFWAYLALLLRVLLLGVNCTAIFFAFITYKTDKSEGWKFEIPTRVVVWIEFLVICCFMLWMIWRFIVVLWTVLNEYYGETDNIYKQSLTVCTTVREWYDALMFLDFNLLLLIRYVSPPAVMSALSKVRRRVYGKYGTRVHREQWCLDLCCCCCFYGRLIFCTLFQGALVVVLAAAALMAVFIKVLQLRFLGTADIQNWNITELLLFGQFVVNIAWLDTRQRDRRAAKLELLYHGSDAESSKDETAAVKLVQDLALLVLRYHYSLFTALAVHHSITSEDISYIYIEDHVEADKPRNQVRHEYNQTKGGGGGGGGSGSRNPEMRRHKAATGGYVDKQLSSGLSGGQVVVEMTPPNRHGRRQAAAPLAPPTTAAAATVGGSSSGGSSAGTNGTRSEAGPSAPPMAPPPTAAPPPLAALPSARFPFDFYNYGHAMGSPVVRKTPEPQLKERYEQSLWRGARN